MHILHKLLFAKLSTCYCVWFWFGQPSLKIPWILCKMCFEAREFKESCLRILILGKLSLKQVFLKNISFHTHAFCSQNSMLWGVSTIFCFVFQKSCFQKILVSSVYFDRSNLFFDQSKLQLKILGLVLCVSIDQTYFSINQKSYREFFLKTFVPHMFFTIQTFPKHVISLFDRSKTPSKIFVIFLQKFCKVFLL